MDRVNFRFAAFIALALAVLTWFVADSRHLPVRDPDDNIWPAYLRLPAVVVAAVALDIIPRVFWRSRHRLRSLPSALGGVVHERWPWSQVRFALAGVAAWYVAYAAFRDLKGYVPFINHRLWDDQFATLDHALWLGHDPATVLHRLFGTGPMAHVFSTVYIAWIGLIPVSIAIALVWTRNRRAGAWFITALSVDWMLGVAVYYLVPTLGPIYSDPETFATLPHTHVTLLQESLWQDRVDVLANPWAADAVQTIAAFPSLHVGMMVTVLLMVELLGLAPWIRIGTRIFLVLTVVATVYLGWHFFTDSLGGALVGSLGVWLAALGTGNHVGLRPQLVTSSAPSSAEQQEPAVGRPV